jgi:hypothetical protein
MKYHFLSSALICGKTCLYCRYGRQVCDYLLEIMKKCNLQLPNSKIRSELSRVIGCVFKKCGKQEKRKLKGTFAKVFTSFSGR